MFQFIVNKDKRLDMKKDHSRILLYHKYSLRSGDLLMSSTMTMELNVQIVVLRYYIACFVLYLNIMHVLPVGR